MSRWNSVGVSSYPQYAQASTGGPTFPAYPAINEPANQTMPNARLQFGDQLIDKFGNTFLYVRATVALAVGQVVRQAFTGDGDVPAAGTVSASTTTRRIFTNITTTLDESALGSFLGSGGTTAGAGQPFFKQIKNQVAVGANTTFDISQLQLFQGIGKYDGDTLAAIPTTGDDVALIRPYNVAVHGAASATTKENGPVGVAMGTVSIAGGTLIQTAGNGSVLGVGSGTAIAIGGPLTPGAAGVVIGGSAIIDAQVGRSYMVWAGATAALIPANIRLYQKM